MNRLKNTFLIISLLFTLSCGTDIDRTLNSDTNQNESASTNTSQVTDPTISPSSGMYEDPVYVEITSTTAGSTAYCTIDGSDPTEASIQVIQGFWVAASKTVRCRAYLEGYTPSAIVQRDYIILEGGNGDDPSSGIAKATLEVEIAIDREDHLRIEDGVLNLVHVSGQRPLEYPSPLVRITDYSNVTREINPWELDPFHFEEGIFCNWETQECVSADLDLELPNKKDGGLSYIIESSLETLVGRDSVSLNENGQIVIRDEPNGSSGYWLSFDLWYETTTD